MKWAGLAKKILIINCETSVLRYPQKRGTSCGALAATVRDGIVLQSFSLLVVQTSRLRAVAISCG